MERAVTEDRADANSRPQWMLPVGGDPAFASGPDSEQS